MIVIIPFSHDPKHDATIGYIQVERAVAGAPDNVPWSTGWVKPIVLPDADTTRLTKAQLTIYVHGQVKEALRSMLNADLTDEEKNEIRNLDVDSVLEQLEKRRQ